MKYEALKLEATAAINTLKFLGYTYHGGERWKPPLGECPAWLNEPAPVPLTDEQVDELWYKVKGEAEPFARAIEAAHGILEKGQP
jgi:hypothetical protein